MKEPIMRGDIFYANLHKGIGSEQNGYRPVVVIQNNMGNRFSSTVIVVALTSKLDSKPVLPTHYKLDNSRLIHSSIVMAEQIATIDKARLDRYIGHLNMEEMQQIDKALAISIGLAIIC